MLTRRLVGLFALAMGVMSGGLAERVAHADDDDVPKIQMAILLDHSGSMGGLINQAREHLWNVVNEFTTLRRNGKRPRLEVALYKYGNAGPEQLVTFTDDLDAVSEALFAIQIQGGSEYCGLVIQTAVNDLKWSEDEDDMKCIFIAGNEPFTQGPVKYDFACKEAIKKGITVSTIHCGDERQGINGRWQHAATLADGSFLTINQNRAVAVIPAPQDDKITALNVKLNATYIAYGAADKRKKFTANQVAQDANAYQLNLNANASRAAAKASANYFCHWDLIDGCVRGTIKIEEIKKEQLPKDLQKLSLKELEAHIEKQKNLRKKIQEEIRELTDARAKFIAAERKKKAETAEAPDDTLDKAIIEAVQKQADKSGYRVEK